MNFLTHHAIIIILIINQQETVSAMPINLQEITENKMLLLHILKTAGKPISEAQFTEIVLSEDFLNYFIFQQYLSELVKNGLVREYEQDGFTFYRITEYGDDALQMFGDRMVKRKRDRITEKLAEERHEILPPVEAFADFDPINFREFNVHLKLFENGMPLMNLTLYAGDRERAISLCNAWRKNYNEVYRVVIESLKEPEE